MYNAEESQERMDLAGYFIFFGFAWRNQYAPVST